MGTIFSKLCLSSNKCLVNFTIGGEGNKGTEKDRKRNRRRRRRRKLHKFKARLAQTKDPKERYRLIEMIRRISFFPPTDIPRE